MHVLLAPVCMRTDRCVPSDNITPVSSTLLSSAALLRSAEVAQYSPLLLSGDLLTVTPGLSCLLVLGEHSSPEFIKQNQLYQKVHLVPPLPITCTTSIDLCVCSVIPSLEWTCMLYAILNVSMQFKCWPLYHPECEVKAFSYS